jgi:SAM-dependent methyltransferase
MEDDKNIFNKDNSLNLLLLLDYQHKPEPFTPGEPLFWDDPHISEQMLATHLDPDVDRASRKPKTIDASVNWIVETLGLGAGAAVLDLGCGPGLYAARLAQRGMMVSGVDFSRRSIAFARTFAAEKGLTIHYRCQNYLTLNDENQYDAVLLIFGDYCTFSPEDRRRILENVYRALRPGGHFVVDVSTRLHRKKYGVTKAWYFSEGGFWRPGPHLVLEGGFDYPGEAIWLDQYIVLEASGKVTVYRNWFQDFDLESISAELTEGGFDVIRVGSDLVGTPYTKEGEWIGLVAKRTA